MENKWISLFIILCCSIGCKKIVNEIPEQCYGESYAIFWYDSLQQEIPESIDPLTGINENYLFGADPFGGWDFTITTDSFTVLFNSQERFISTADYEKLSHEQWKQEYASKGQYSITSDRMTRTELWIQRGDETVFLGTDFHNNKPLEGEVSMSSFKAGECYFLKINFWTLLPESENKTHRIQGELAVPYGPLNL
jgi:hypothetical protein